MNLGDFKLEDTIYVPFTTRAFATGIPTALASGEVQVYEDASTTQITTADTLAASLDSVVGFNMATITATAATGFETGKSYTCILAAGTVDSVSVVGEVIGHFTIEASAAYLKAVDVLTDTAEIGAAGAGLTNIPWNSSWDAEVQSECADALTAYDPPTRAELTTDVNTIVTDLDDIKGTGFVKDTHSLFDIEAYVDILDDATSGNVKIATDVAAVLEDTTEIGAAGAGLTNINLPDQTMNITGDITGNLSGSVGSVAGTVDGSVASVTAAVSLSQATGTADSGTSTTLVDAARTEADNYWIGDLLVVTSGTIAGQTRTITGFTASSDTITVEPAFTDAVDTNTYEIWPGPSRVELRTATQTSVDNIEADTNELQQDDYPTTLATLATASALTTVDTVVAGIQTDLDNATDGLGAIKTVADTIAVDVANVDGIVPAAAGDSMALTTAAVDAIWDETMSSHNGADSSGAHLLNILADTATTIPGTIATAQADLDIITGASGAFIDPGTGANQLSISSGVVAADMTKISGDTTAADNLEESATAIVTGTVGAGVHTTAAIVASDVTDEGDSTFNGRLLVFTSGTACTYEAGVILTYTSSTGAMVFDSATWTTAPSENDTFVIL